MTSIDLPPNLEKFRAKLEATIKPYAAIHTRLTRKVSLWQSKFAGFPYLPKNFDYPKTPNGDYLYLLAQINFTEVSYLEGFPEKGILQFYLARTNSYGLDFDNSTTNQVGFRVLYFPKPDLDKNNFITKFDFLPTLWDEDRDNIPFYVCPGYTPHRNDCFALKFRLKYAPISYCDYKFEELIGIDIWEILEKNEYALLNKYEKKFVEGHKIGGYPHFTQEDFRKFSTEEEPYILLLQIDSDYKENLINIQWGDIGVCNFWIKESALRELDFSKVLYHWDCS